MIEKRLEGMATRQEEFLGKLETTILDYWKNQIDKNIGPTPLYTPLSSIEVQRQNNSLVVTPRSARASSCINPLLVKLSLGCTAGTCARD